MRSPGSCENLQLFELLWDFVCFVVEPLLPNTKKSVYFDIVCHRFATCVLQFKNLCVKRCWLEPMPIVI